MQQTLRLSSGLRQRFEALFDASPLGLFTHDAEDQIIEANLTLANLLQMERAHLIGQHIGNFIAPQDHACFIQQLTQLRDSKSSGTAQCTLTLITAHQTEIKVQMESTPHITGAGDIDLIHSSILLLEAPVEASPDISSENHSPRVTEFANGNAGSPIPEHTLAEKQSRQHQNELAHISRLNTMGEMTSGLAHEINQPLTAINSYAKSCLRLLESDSDKQAQVPAILEQVCSQAQRATSIIRHLRDFVSKSATHRKTTELITVVRLAANMMHSELQENNITLKMEAPSKLPAIIADAIQLEQVLINLLHNASEAMSNPPNTQQHRQLRIRLDIPDTAHVRIAISDTGPGIPSDIAEKIFTPFYSTKQNGMGLGLAISRTIVEDHGGTLSHASNTEGGTTFTFTLAIGGKPSSH